MTDNINPEYNNTQNTSSAGQPVKKSNGLALLALIIGGLGTGIGIYNIEQLSKFGENFTLGQENPAIAQLEVTLQKQAQAQENFATTAQLTKLEQQLLALSKQNSGIDQAQVETLIDKAVSAAQISPEKIAEFTAKNSLNAEQIKTLINQELLGFAQGENKIDFSKEIAAVQKTEAGARLILNKIQTQAQAIKTDTDELMAKIQTQVQKQAQAIKAGTDKAVTKIQTQAQEKAQAIKAGADEAITKLQTKAQAIETGADQVVAKLQTRVQTIQTSADQAVAKIQAQAKTANESLDHKIRIMQDILKENTATTNPYPLLNTLRMAQFAAADNNYTAAKMYLDQAEESFAFFNLNSAPYADFHKAVTELQKQYSALAGQPSAAVRLDKVIATIGEWPFKNVNPINLLSDKKADDVPKDWTDKIKGVGQNILENTVTVTPIDDAGLAWVNTNEALQNLLRENVRLDLAFARNALQLHDYSSYTSVAERLETEIGRYFDTKNNHVAAALKTLTQLKVQAEHAPDIGTLIQQVEQAK